MSTPLVGEIMMFGGNFAPRDWALCDGQLLDISQNDLLFSLIGTVYGGDGRTTFALPDLRGRVPIHYGAGPGLSNHPIGSRGGFENVTLTTGQLPAHTHQAKASNNGGSDNPAGSFWANSATGKAYAGTANTNMNVGALGASGGSQPHENMIPFQVVNYCIALFGVYPVRS